MADKTGYIGRNPNDSAVTVARQFFTASGVTTAFTFASGYLTGYLDVYVDGVKKRVADEFTATDGSTFDVLQGGVGAGSTVEAVAYKAFNAAAVSGDITGNFDVSGNTTLGGSLGVTGGTTVTNLVVTGISTLGTGTTVGFANTAFNLGGTPNISVDLLSAVDINVSGAATIGGVLTYEDVTNIDSIGIVTAREGVVIIANGLDVAAGVGTFAADLSIADKLIHTGDTNTSIRFPSADTITAETAGVERLRIDSTGDVGLVGIATATGLVVVAGSGIYAGHTGVVTAVSFDGSFTGNVTGAASQVTVADESSDTTCFPLFATAATGNLPPKSGSNLTFNSSSGALTATSFAGNISGGTVAGSTGSFTGNVNTGPELTVTGTEGVSANLYLIADDGDDNGDGWRINSNQDDNDLTISNNTTGSYVDKFTLLKTGELTLTNDLIIPDKIIHTGDTNTAIRFPAADTFTVETGGSEAARFDSSQRLILGTTTASSAGNSQYSKLEVSGNTSGATGPGHLTLKRGETTASLSSGDTLSRLIFSSLDGGDFAYIQASADAAPGSNDFPGRLMFFTCADGASSATERLRITSAGLVRVPDNGKFTAGAGDDLQIYHTGSHSYISNSTGYLHVNSANFEVKNVADNETMLLATQNGAVTLYHDDSAKLATTSSGVTVTGTVSDSIGNLRSLVKNSQSGGSTYTLVAGDAGKIINKSNGGGVTVPNGVLSAGDMITILNNSGSDFTITQGSSFSLYNTADASTGNKTLAGRGMATIYFLDSGNGYISGAGLS